jgi:hypothetical protein
MNEGEEKRFDAEDTEKIYSFTRAGTLLLTAYLM